uniref:Uncharacterized protein n=1 Tax=Serinus canaria TaxID=9135 RepID=A0A8C9NAG6_SERCA
MLYHIISYHIIPYHICYIFGFLFGTFLKCLTVARIIQRKLLPLCEEIFISPGTEALWMKRDISGLLEELMISLTLLGKAFPVRSA